MGKKDHLTKDQQSAYNAIVLRREPNVFVTGGGGVGKSWILSANFTEGKAARMKQIQ